MSSYESYRQQALTHDTEDANDSLSDKNSLLSGRVANPKQKHSIPHSARLGLRVLSLLLSLAAVGILAHATLIYRMTTDEIFTYPYGTKFKAWPQPLHLRPTLLMIGAAVTAALLNIVALLLSLGTFDHIRSTKLGPYTAISGCFVALAASIAAAVYFQSWNTRDKGQHDLWSWTCTHRDVELQNKNLGFGTVCSEMQATFYLILFIAGIEGLNLLTVIYNVIFAKPARKTNSKSTSGGSKGYRKISLLEEKNGENGA